jgi:hypothetical protein
MAAGAVSMGRPKKGAKKPEPVVGPDERVAIIHLKGTPAYAAWLEAVNAKSHIPKAAIIRLAVAEWAARNGHPAPPEM